MTETKQVFGYYNEDGKLEFVAFQEHEKWADREFLMWFLENRDEMAEMEDLLKRGWSRGSFSVLVVFPEQAQWNLRGKQD